MKSYTTYKIGSHWNKYITTKATYADIYKKIWHFNDRTVENHNTVKSVGNNLKLFMLAHVCV